MTFLVFKLARTCLYLSQLLNLYTGPKKKVCVQEFTSAHGHHSLSIWHKRNSEWCNAACPLHNLCGYVMLVHCVVARKAPYSHKRCGCYQGIMWHWWPWWHRYNTHPLSIERGIYCTVFSPVLGQYLSCTTHFMVSPNFVLSSIVIQSVYKGEMSADCLLPTGQWTR